MVINHEVKDLDSFISRLACAEELLSDGSLLDAKGYLPCGFITRNAAVELYKTNKKHDDRVRRRHNFVEKFVEMNTYIAKDVLFETMIDLMDILNKRSLQMSDFEYVHDHVEDVYDMYIKLKQTEDQM